MNAGKFLEATDNLFVALLLGKSGSGKTGAVASFAEEGPLLLIDLDRRAKGIGGCTGFLEQATINNIEIERPDIAKGFDAIDQLMELLLAKQNIGQQNYKTVVIDSASTLQALLLEDSIRKKGLAGGKTASGNDRVRKVGKVAFTSPEDYLYSQRAFMQIWINFALQMKTNLIFTGWVVDRWGHDPASDNDYAEKIVIGQQMLATSKLAEQIPGYFDEVYLFEKEQIGGPNAPVKYKVYFETDLAKTARPCLKGRSPVDITGKSFRRVLKALCDPKDASK